MATFEQFQEQAMEWLKPDGPVAVIIKQPLAPVDDEDPVIFPPTYPITTLKGRTQTIWDGEYRVSVEFPPNDKVKTAGDKENQRSGYNIDRFADGTNICEIDSPQSQANRIEPLFATIANGSLVPQIRIQVGNDPLHKKTVNLLVDAGHRAADAVVRMSSMANDFHKAFLDAKDQNHFTLAILAPTSLLFGVWDSRSTFVKIQRVIKANIRARNVLELTKSAQFTPAADYVLAGAVNESLDQGEGDKNALSTQGMKHALATQTAGGVRLTERSTLVRTININLAALRQLKAPDDERRKALQKYILGLALVAATAKNDLNLREGCNLRYKGEQTTRLVSLQTAANTDDAAYLYLNEKNAINFAESAATEFFKLAGIDPSGKDKLEVLFESGVAEEFLGMPKADRDKLVRLGPITQATLKLYQKNKKKGGDAFEELRKLVGKLKIGKKGVLSDSPLKNLKSKLEEISQDANSDDYLKKLATDCSDILANVTNPEETISNLSDLLSSREAASEVAVEGDSEVPAEAKES